MKRVQISILAYDGWLPVMQSTSLMGAVVNLLQQKNYTISYHFRVGDSILPRARNAEFSNFINSDYDEMLMVDADTIISSADIAKIIESPVDVIGAPYRTRAEPLVWSSIRWKHDDIKLDERGLLEVDCVGTGFLKVSKVAAQKVWDAETIEYNDGTCKSKRARPVFWFEIQGEHMWGEDLVFCQKLRKQGYDIYVDPSIAANHLGSMQYYGKLGDWLKEMPAVMVVDDILGIKSVVNNHLSSAYVPGIDMASVERDRQKREAEQQAVIAAAAAEKAAA